MNMPALRLGKTCRGPLRRGTAALAALGAVALAACAAPPRRHEVRQLPPPPPAPTSQTVYFYPERGQSAERQDRDRFECYQWARQQTGIDPGMTPLRAVRPPPVVVERDARGAVIGGITGAAIGATVVSPHHAGEGMVLGAVLGAVLGTVVGAAADNARAEAAEHRAEMRASAAQVRAQAPLGEFRRAMSACMGGRGYTVG
jgi:outer membrane lipoprotein SlyB